MKFSQKLLSDESLKLWNEHGELLPDPNLVWNIEHLVSFIEIELESWMAHCIKVEADTKNISCQLKCVELLRTDRIQIYIKSLYNVSNYFISCIEALERLLSQLENIKRTYRLYCKKPRLNVDMTFYEKVKYVRNVSFVHQGSSHESNVMNKRLAMSWMPTISHKINEVPNCENYIFCGGKWQVSVNGSKKNSDIDVSITGFYGFAQTALGQIKVRQSRIIEYYDQLSDMYKLNLSTEK